MRRSNSGYGATPDAGDAAAAGSPTGSDEAGEAARVDAADIEALLAALAQFRLSAAADLSAVAGALNERRPDVAADVVGGTLRDLEHFRRRTSARLLKPSVPVPEAQPSPSANTVPHPRLGVRWQAKVLAGALAAALTIRVMPHFSDGSGHHAQTGAATAAEQPLNIRLASSEFATLRSTLQSPSPTPGQILAAGQHWQRVIATSLPQAATSVSTATHIVNLLRQERTLLQASPTLRTQSKRSAAVSLRDGSDSLLTHLRAIADERVLAVLPKVLGSLPAPATPTASPSPGPNPSRRPVAFRHPGRAGIPQHRRSRRSRPHRAARPVYRSRRSRRSRSRACPCRCRRC